MMAPAPLRPHEIMALDFLDRNGPDAPGEVNSEEVMAAHLLFLDLKDRKLVSTTQGKTGRSTRSRTLGGRRWRRRERTNHPGSTSSEMPALPARPLATGGTGPRAGTSSRGNVEPSARHHRIER